MKKILSFLEFIPMNHVAYQMIVVDKLTDITSDLSDLEEFLNDAAAIGVSVFELSTMQVRHHVYMEGCPECSPIGNIIRMWS